MYVKGYLKNIATQIRESMVTMPTWLLKAKNLKIALLTSF
jgi:hypothetical protein